MPTVDNQGEEVFLYVSNRKKFEHGLAELHSAVIENDAESGLLAGGMVVGSIAGVRAALRGRLNPERELWYSLVRFRFERGEPELLARVRDFMGDIQSDEYRRAFDVSDHPVDSS